MAEVGEIDIAPDYQRLFLWDEDRELELIESSFPWHSYSKLVHGDK